MAGGAFADAPDPVASATTGAVVTNADGSRTVTVHGAWVWTTHRSDCNLDKRAVGVAIDWNDPSAPGHVVGKAGGPSADVGTPTDNLVHPAEPGVDAPDIASWRGGCGVYSPANDYNSGRWGPLAHTYPASFSGQISVCPVMYDVHLAANGGAPKNAKEIQAGDPGHNGDNSVEANNNTPAGNGCFIARLLNTPAIVTDAGNDVTLGGALRDTATLAGLLSGATGVVTFALYGPDDATCANSPVFTSAVPVHGNGSYTSGSFTPTRAGTYRWIASYSGDATDAPVSGACNDVGENVVVRAPGAAGSGPAGSSSPSSPASGSGPATGSGTVAARALARGCAGRVVPIVVTGRRIRRVTFRVDGHIKLVLHAPNSRGRYVYNVDTTRMKRVGLHRVGVKVYFARDSNTPKRILSLAIFKCATGVRPQFTG